MDGRSKWMDEGSGGQRAAAAFQHSARCPLPAKSPTGFPCFLDLDFCMHIGMHIIPKVETPIHDNIRELATWECKEHEVKS